MPEGIKTTTMLDSAWTLDDLATPTAYKFCAGDFSFGPWTLNNMHSCCKICINRASVKPSIGGCLLTQVLVLDCSKDNKCFLSSCMQRTHQGACMTYCKLLMSICVFTEDQLMSKMYGQSANAVCMCAGAAYKTDSNNQFDPGSTTQRQRRQGRVQVRHKISNVRDAGAQACLQGHVYLRPSMHIWHACLTTMTASGGTHIPGLISIVELDTCQHMNMLQSKAIQKIDVHVISCSVIVMIIHQQSSS